MHLVHIHGCFKWFLCSFDALIRGYALSRGGGGGGDETTVHVNLIPETRTQRLQCHGSQLSRYFLLPCFSVFVPFLVLRLVLGGVHIHLVSLVL